MFSSPHGGEFLKLFPPLCKYSMYPNCMGSGNAPHSQFSPAEFGFNASCCVKVSNQMF